MCTEGVCEDPNEVCTPYEGGCDCKPVTTVVSCDDATPGMCSEGVCENPDEVCQTEGDACGCRPDPNALKLSGGGATSCAAAPNAPSGLVLFGLIGLALASTRRRRTAA